MKYKLIIDKISIFIFLSSSKSNRDEISLSESSSVSTKRSNSELSYMRSSSPSDSYTSYNSSITSKSQDSDDDSHDEYKEKEARQQEKEHASRKRESRHSSKTMQNEYSSPELTNETHYEKGRKKETAVVNTQTSNDLLENYDPSEKAIHPKEEIITYRVEIKTGDKLGASTKAKIHIVLHGENGKTKEIELKNCKNNRVPFQKGQVRKNYLDLTYLHF